jgi:CBS domain containing-hemolysin-like protein
LPEPSSSDAFGIRMLRYVRLLLTGRAQEPSLRDQIEEAIDDSGGEAHDDLSATERTMLKNLLHFGEATADDVAVPRSDIVAFEASLPFRALIERFREAGHSRMPVFEGDLDHVIGMVHVKDVYSRIAETFDDAVSSAPFESITVAEFLRPVLFVPASMGVLDLLARMRQGRTHMAMVIDEFGGTDGLVTIEDIVEEIVGDIEDEHDEAEEGVMALDDGAFEADARVELEDIAEAIGTNLDEDDEDEVDTIGGLVVLLAGRVPVPGESVVHPSGWRLEVVAGDTRKVSRVRLHPPVTENAEAAAG